MGEVTGSSRVHPTEPRVHGLWAKLRVRLRSDVRADTIAVGEVMGSARVSFWSRCYLPTSGLGLALGLDSGLIYTMRARDIVFSQNLSPTLSLALTLP